MKIKLSILAALALIAAGCTDETNIPVPPAKEGKTVTITAAISGDAATRLAYDDPNLKLAWQSGDDLKLTGYDTGGNELGTTTFTYTGTGNQFTGTPVEGAVKYKAEKREWGSHTQYADNSVVHVGMRIRLEDETLRPLTGPFVLKMTNSILKLVLSDIPADVGALKYLSWTVQKDETAAAKSAVLNFSDGSVTFSETKRDLTAYLVFDPDAMSIPAGGKVTVMLGGDKFYAYTQTVAGGKEYEPGNRYAATITGGWEQPANSVFLFTIKTAGANEEYEIRQRSSDTCPADLTIDWGDGTAPATIAEGASLSKVIASHIYAEAGTYTVTLTSNRPDPALRQIPRLTFRDDTKLTAVLTPFPNMGSGSLYATFSGCTALESIPAGLFDKNTQADGFRECFKGCSALQSIPAGLFDKNTRATGFLECFKDCSALENIPAGLFDKNTLVTTFYATFENCTALESIPAGLFDNNTQATNFSSIFDNCAALTSIPAGLFDNNTQATDFRSTFIRCTALTSIPAELFDNNTQATNFSYTFASCHALTSIPAGLFDKNTRATDFQGTFISCRALTSIPAGLFDNNPQVTNFSYCFNGCTALTSIPDGLFDNNTHATNFSYCFSYCNNLKLNPRIFPSKEETPDFFKDKNMDFTQCFREVGSSLSGDFGAAPELWAYNQGSGSWSHFRCFLDAKVTNSDAIPADWK